MAIELGTIHVQEEHVSKVQAIPDHEFSSIREARQKLLESSALVIGKFLYRDVIKNGSTYREDSWELFWNGDIIGTITFLTKLHTLGDWIHAIHGHLAHVKQLLDQTPKNIAPTKGMNRAQRTVDQ